MSVTIQQGFDALYNTIDEAKLVAWDGCHKIYLAMDSEQAAWFNDGYPHVVSGTPEQMLEAVETWWEQSCFLRFVEAVSTNKADPNAGFVAIIPQFAGDEDDADDDE